MRINKQDREYHKIKKANRQMHYDKMSEEEAIKDFSYEECMKFGYIQMGKRLPYYYGKDKEAAQKKTPGVTLESILNASNFKLVGIRNESESVMIVTIESTEK